VLAVTVRAKYSELKKKKNGRNMHVNYCPLMLMRPPELPNEADKMARQIEQLGLASWPESKYFTVSSHRISPL
jgi:hypothetical protein